MQSNTEEVVGFTDAPSEGESRDLTTMGRELFMVDSNISALESQLEAAKVRRKELTEKELPDYMMKVGQDLIGLPEFGVDLELDYYYHANIAADWEPEKRQTAFDYLASLGEEDMIKAEFTILFPKYMLPVARWLAEQVKKLKPKMEISEEVGSGKKRTVRKVMRTVDIPEAVVGLSVPWNTLTAWLKRRLQAGEEVDLDVLGATVGRIVKIKEREQPKKVKA